MNVELLFLLWFGNMSHWGVFILHLFIGGREVDRIADHTGQDPDHNP